MSALVGVRELPEISELPQVKPLDEAAWQAWVTKGRAEEQRSSDKRVNVLKWVLSLGLLAAAGLWFLTRV